MSATNAANADSALLRKGNAFRFFFAFAKDAFWIFQATLSTTRLACLLLASISRIFRAAASAARSLF